MTPLREAAERVVQEIERYGCLCGARGESLDTHPHVLGCSIAYLKQNLSADGAGEDVAGWLEQFGAEIVGVGAYTFDVAEAFSLAARRWRREHPATPAGASTSCNLAHPPDWRCYVCHVPPSPRKQGRVEHCRDCRGFTSRKLAPYQPGDECPGIRRES